MSLVTEQWEFLKDVAKLIQFAESKNVVLTGGELFRTQEQQDIYLKNGKSKTANSQHMKRLAIDFNFFFHGELTYDIPDLQFLGEYWESLNTKNRWGGNFKSFKDAPHFERYL
jgi:hypothetical protein